MLQPPRKPWFTSDAAPAIEDFWRVYDDRFEDVEGPTAGYLRAILRAGFEAGDWTAYEELLDERGARCASLGLAASEVTANDLVRALTPHLVRASSRGGPSPRRSDARSKRCSR